MKPLYSVSVDKNNLEEIKKELEQERLVKLLKRKS